MLGLMAWLFNMRGDVPSNRPEIYRDCAVLMFEKWDPDRDIKANIPVNFDRLQLFSNIASKIFGHPELSAGVEAAWLEKETRPFFQTVYENKAQAFEAAKALVAFITGRAWVMSEVGDKVFAFTHQTFLEYFFARHLDEMHDTVKEIIALVMPKVLRREWDMVSHLSLQIKTHRNLRRQNEALDQLRAMVLGRHDAKQRAALVSFASRSLEYLVGAEFHIKAAATVIVDYAIDSAIAGDMSAWADVSQCAQCCIERRDFVREAIVKRLAEEFRREDPDRLSAIQYAVSHFDVPYLVTGSEPQRLAADVSGGVREELKVFVHARISRSAFHAALAWQWYGTLDKPLLAKYGIETYLNFRWPQFDRIDGLSFIAIAGSTRFQMEIADHIKKRANEVLVWLGAFGFSSGPFRRSLFRSSEGDGVDLSIWEQLLMNEKHSPDVTAGLLFVMMIATELQGRQKEENTYPHHKSSVVERNKIIEQVLAKRSLHELSFFPQIRAAVQAETLFRIEA